jgi:hypothetical protein
MYRQEDKEVTIAGRKYANNKSRFQEDRWARDRDKLGDLSGQFDGLPLRRQVEVLIGMDVAQVQPGTMSEYIEVMTTSDGPKVRWESAQDIQHVRQAQQELEAYFEVSPQSQGRMQRLREWLRYAEFKALKADNTAQGREALRMYEAGLFDYEGRR